MDTDTSHEVLPCGDDASLEVWIDRAADLAVIRVRGNLQTALAQTLSLDLPRHRIFDIRLADPGRVTGARVLDFATSSALRAAPDTRSAIVADQGLQWGLARQAQAVTESHSGREIQVEPTVERAAGALGIDPQHIPSLFR